ncbi:MAG: 3-phosphoserine/phosphohydroxythreonine transaminase [Deltaproteobacteria bacterium]|jgi:phosphoserine aminotransferase|nr:3-phosphoserine/phosphohydroxythreonine transaminase [Deltaproteobacteria bacterium]
MRYFNFNGGPAALPEVVLEQVAREILDWQGTGMSIMENSHRSKEVVAMCSETQEILRSLLGVGSEWSVLFCQGGASLQFAMLPLNFASDQGVCDYINTGLWSTKAFQEAKICGAAPHLAASSEEANFTYIPQEYNYSLRPNYVYLCSNNTVRGTRWPSFPDKAPGPLVGDFSSEFLSRPLDLSNFAVVFAGAQKNVAPAGLTIVLIRKDFAESGRKGLPHMLDYRTYIENDSMYNTPPVFSIYVANLVFKWIRDTVGGLAKMEELNKAKADLLYGFIDQSGGFYRGTARADSRSPMNVTYRLAKEELEKPFLDGAKKEGLAGLGGHRSVGGVRASLYNALGLEAVKALTSYMKHFMDKNG